MSHLTAMFLKEIEMTKTVRNAASELIENHIEDQLKVNEKKIEELQAENANLIRNARKMQSPLS